MSIFSFLVTVVRNLFFSCVAVDVGCGYKMKFIKHTEVLVLCSCGYNVQYP